MRRILAAAAFLAAGAATPSWAAPNDIIWDTPASKAGAAQGGDVSTETMTPLGGGQPDKNGIIWDTPGNPSRTPAAKAPATSAPACSRPDAGGITWNAPPVKPGAPPSGALLTPPSGRLAQAPSPTADGPCREFQTSIVIDGKREPAHGTVCQQADGTWRVVNK